MVLFLFLMVEVLHTAKECIYLQPSTIQGPPSEEDTTVTATPIDVSEGVTICVTLDKPSEQGEYWYDREGNWKQPLLD